MLGVTEYLLIVAGLFLIIQYFKPKKNLPPGPPGLPLIGNLLQVVNQTHLKQYEWAERYGKIHSFTVGGTIFVVVNDVKLAKEVLFDTDFADRPPQDVLDLFSGGNYDYVQYDAVYFKGIINTNGQPWEEQRRWSLRKLRDFGLGKTSMEGIILDEVNEVVQYFKGRQGEVIGISDRFDVATLNALWTLLTGERMKQDDPKIRELMDTFDKIIPVITSSGLGFAPWLKYFRPFAYKNVKKFADHVMSFARVAVAEHFVTYEEGTLRDFIDEYISEINRTKDSNSSFYKETGRKNLEGVISDSIQAGAQTTSNTIKWCICYLTQFPEVQQKLQKELDSVLGNRSVTLSDKTALPYTEAVIWETLRYSSLVSGGVQHGTFVEKEVEGYTIPKNAWLLTNIYYIHHDPKVWGDPENFRPERFLSADGKNLVKMESLIPFQLGRRQCIGESMARDSLFLYVSTIFQQFDIKKIEKEMPTPQNSFILIPNPYNFVFKSRRN